jgi:hypothetical protein
MSSIVVNGRRYHLDNGDERLAARVALHDAGMDRVSLSPPDGREYGVDGLFSYEGLIDASNFERYQLEQYRLRHMHENAPEFMGYSEIPAQFVLRSLVEADVRPQSPAEASEEVIECVVRGARAEAEHALDNDALERELDAWARRRPARVTLERTEAL